LGQLIDNVQLERNSFCGHEDIIYNGGFEKGHNLGHGWRIFKNGQFKGWKCNNEIEVGWGRIYNKRWPQNTHVTELDANHNTDIYQEFKFDEYLRLKD
jgi:hypothetical protein